jgi:Uma2 family endonuclease
VSSFEDTLLAGPVTGQPGPIRAKAIRGSTACWDTLTRAAELPTPAAEPTFMGMPDTLTPVYWTADMARRLPRDGNRYEVVYGELLVTPAPRLWHQQLVGRLHVALATYLEVHRAGVVLTAPADISWGTDVLVQPDVFVVPVEQARTLEWSAIRDLLLVAEVLSPSTPRHDRFSKRRRYQEARVPVYWIIDGEARQVEVWTPADVFPRIERERLIWQPGGGAETFTLSLEELFRPIA